MLREYLGAVQLVGDEPVEPGLRDGVHRGELLLRTLHGAHGNAADIWLGINWFIWGGLWFCFFLLLTMERPIARSVGWATVGVAVATCWAFGYTLLQGVVAF